MHQLRAAATAITLVALGCQSVGPQEPLPGQIALEVVASGLASPVHASAPAGDPRLFVVEQAGRIRVIENGQVRSAPFLDITDRVLDGGERGLLSVAFHPDYAANGLVYVNYTDNQGDTRVERYTRSADPNRLDTASAMLILTVDQPFANHNGGHQMFGPDGMFYIGLGDGGSGGDPRGNGQNLNALLGKLLRIDVDGGSPYVIPADNPFAGQAGRRGEIWAYGLRNPWRFAFDPVDRLLYIADVGQARWEEVNAMPQDQPAVNYGWNTMEASVCYGAASCNRTGLTLPVLEYDHGEGCSVTGGAVYRGQAIPGLAGHYLYADYCGGWLRSFRYHDGRATDRREWDVGPLTAVSSFGHDAAGELYVLSRSGTIYRIIPTG
ncbi:MAG TPA: PQQ-dependent sugar dehydrogenase [Gemmatimonadales bacterium]|nr:PQQ-dependent sugar dehydrogenase [Gemmatimonadales bacterium]